MLLLLTMALPAHAAPPSPWPGETPGPVRWSSVHGLLVGGVVQDGLAQRPQVVSVPFDDAGPATAAPLGPWPAGVGEITALAVLDEARRLGFADCRENRELFYETMEAVVLPQLDGIGLDATGAWKARACSDSDGAVGATTLLE